MAIKRTPGEKPALPKRRNKKAAIWERIEEIGRTIPADELRHFPKDGARNLHHYLHGAAKQD